MHDRGALRLILLATLPLLSLWGPAVGEDPRFGASAYYVTIPSSLDIGGSVFQEALELEGRCNVAITSVYLDGNGSEIFAAMESAGVIMVLVNTSNLQVGVYELTITVTGTFLQCPSSASDTVTTSIAATSGETSPVITSSQSGASPMATMTFSAAQTSSVEVAPTTFSPSPTPSPTPLMNFAASARLVVSVVLPPTVLSVDNSAPFPTDTITFNCSFWNTSANSVSYEWLVDGVMVENETQSLYILNVSFSDNGTTVHCLADGEMSNQLTVDVRQPRLSIVTDPAPTLNLTFQQLQLPALVLQSGTTVNGTCTFFGGPQFELFGAFSFVEVAADGALLEGEEIDRPIENGVPEVNPIFSPGVAFCRAVVDGRNVTSQMILFTIIPKIQNLTASPSMGVSQGSPLTLTCAAVGGPTLNVTWTTPTGPRVGSVISVDNVTADDAGEYGCEVTSEAGTTNDSITIRVGVRVVDQPDDQLVSVGDIMLLTCDVSGSEPISYQWLKDGELLQDDGRVNGSNDSVLVVDPVEGDDFGGYRCNASNDVDQVLSDVAMVTVAPVIVNLTAIPFTGVPQGSPLNLTCEAVGVPILNVTWTTPTGPQVGSVISVDNVTADDAGEYTCEVTSEAGTANDSITIRVGVRVVDQPEDQSVSVNGTLRLTCNVSGSEPISYQWLKDGQQLQDDGRVSGSNASVLVVDPVEGDDFGGYQCNASNDVDQVQSEVATVAVAPVIVNLTASPSTGVSQGIPLNLACEAVGGPTLNVTWTTPTGPRVGHVISIDSVTADDAGEYRCEVTSEAGTTNDSITIRVGVRVEVQPEDQFVRVNDTLSLTCNVSGSEPIYQWLKDGQQLQDDGRVSGSNDSVLVVDPVEGDDFGGYQCNASNDVDQVQSDVAMVAVAPVIVNLAASPFTGVPQGSPLNLTCEAVGGPTLNVTWTTPTGPEVGSVISVDNVTADDAGEYTCEVATEAGTTNDSITIRVGVSVVDQPEDQSVSVNGTLRLICNVSGSEPISYQWLKDGRQLQDDGRVSGSNASVLVVDPVEGDDFGGYRCNASNDVDQVLSDVAMVAVAPVIVDLTASPSTRVSQGSLLNLTCEAVGGPTLMVTWTTPTGPRAGSVIYVDSVTADNAGEYRCEVTQAEAGTTNESITIRVGVREEVQPMDQFVSVRDMILLTCNVSGSEPISYQWLKDNEQLQDDGRVRGSNDSVLVVDPVEGDDFGGYRCNASNDVDQVQSDVAMVAVAPVIVNLTASPFTGVPQGSPLNLTCEAVGGPTLNVTWTTPTVPRVGRVISIDNVTADDAGEYTCEVMSEAGTTNESITIRVGVRVAMVDQPEDQSVSVNGTLRLTCNVSGSEPISYQWLKDGQQLQDDVRVSGSNASVLVVDPVEGDDFGGYRCNASNDVNQVLSDVAMVAVAPVIVDLTASPSTRVSQGSLLNLTCEAVGGPTLVVTWTTPTGMEVGSVIYVDSVTADNAGEYRCEVTQAEAGTTNESITIRVGVRVVDQPDDQFVSINDTLRLICNVSGSEPISYQWLKDRQQLQDDGRVSGSNASVLVVDPVEGDDFGGYQCNASNDVDQVQSDVAMVAVAPVIVNLTANPSTGVSQTIPLNLTCEAVGGPTLNVTWTTPTGPEVGSVISVDNVTADDAGEYTCEVATEAGTTNDSISIRVGVQVEVQPMDQFVSVNDTLRLTCNVSGSETISYQWLKDGQQLQDDGRVSGSNDSVLVVDPVEGDDFGGYRCNASNDVDQVQSEVAMVAVAPNNTVVVAPATETLSVNGSVIFTCVAQGGPSNVFQWSLNGGDLHGENGTMLSITGVDAADGGNYRCTVSNAAGVDGDLGTLFVNPILLEEPVDTNISLFENGMIICRARGFPTPKVLWYQNGTRLDVAALGNVNVTRVMMSCITTSTLTITNATFANSGRYFCSATSSDPNVISVNSSEVDVIVQHTPEQPINVTVTNVTPFSVALAWVEPHDNNAPINDYIITIDSVGTSSTIVRANASVEAFNVTDLRPFVNYTFTVAAENDEGVGLASTPVFRRTLEFFPSAPLNLTVSAIGRRSINVTWSPPANPNGILLFYQLEYSIVEQSSMTLDVPAESLAASLVELTPAQVYQVTVRANTSVGFGDSSEPVRATTEIDNPSAPVNLTATNVTGSANAVNISWAPPLEPNGIILTYEIIVEGSSTPRNRREADMTGFEESTRNVSNTTTSDIIANLTSYSENNVTVLAYTSAGPGEQAMVMFRTGEDTPLAPRNLALQVTSSQSIRVSWTRPLFFRGQLLRYEIFFTSSSHSGMHNIPSSDQNSITFPLTGLVINTVYEVSVRAVTGAGPGENVTDFVRTQEDAPPPVMNLVSKESGSNIEITWDPPGVENGDYFYRLSVSFQSTFSNDYPDRSEEDLFEHDFDRTGSNDMPFSSFRLMNTSDDDNRQQVAASNTLLHRIRSSASYKISLAGVNQLLDVPSVFIMSTLTTSRTRATPVTSLAAVAVSNNTNFTLQVSWDLPLFPNGRIQNYVLQYRQLESDMGPVSTESTAKQDRVEVAEPFLVIHGLPPFTFFEVTVTANNDLPGFPTILTERTNASVPAEPPVLPTSGWYADYQSLTIPLLIPSEDTGILMRYDVIVFGPTGESSPNEERRLELANMAINNDTSATVRSVASFKSLEEVMAANSPLEHSPVSDDSQYFVFIRLEFEPDGSTALVTTSQVMSLRTQPIALPVVLVLFSVALLAGVAVAVVVFFLVRRYKKSRRYKLSDNIPEQNDHEMETGIYINRAVPQWDAPTSPIPVEEFPNHVRNLHSDDDYRFSEEYKNVEPNHNPTVDAFSNPANAQKNRYGNITCYDHSRVRLTPTEGVAGSDYINGNFLDGYKQPNAFIATQGPVPDSIVDFWRMVWEQEVPTIVMLTNLEERGRIKCHRYWPTEKTSIYGSVKVTVQEELELSDYTIRTFSVIMSGFREERIVTQFHFTTWPDFGVPSHPTPLLLFIRRVKAIHPSNRGPIVVHCSAGVGRSGTFITLHTQMSRIAEEKNVDVFRFVRSMRSRRCLMVQTEAQYIFIHDAILEVLECGMTEVAARELPSQYKYLQTVDETSGKTLLELELQRLSNTLHSKKLQTEASKAPNKGKNRFGDILPFDDTRCRLTSVIGVPSSDYINASFISGYVRKKAFIATQGPLPDTVGDFWRMVWEYKCASIVMLTKEKEGPRVRCHRYWPDGTDMYGQTQVVLLTENQYAGYIQREFKLIDTKDKSSLPVRQFQFTGWPEESGRTPEHGADLIDLIGQVQKWQRTAGDRPVVVHCSGGSGRTGTYIAIANLLDRLKTEGVVDIFQTVRALRMQRPRMVHTLEQYRYCYTTVLEYLESFDLYANFK